ncbi:MAG: ATP-binding domain-containing protein [Bacteroidales bacterium]|jgi:DNA helicase IV|nr:ATP-binding domain-containing protein [Bacteroidales bacterium]
MDNDFFIDYMDMDEYQRQLVDRKIDKSMVVTGSAGSGKSVIALHKAKQVAQITDDFAIVVFTKTLKRYFEDGIKQLGLKNVYHYNGWSKRNVKYLIVDEIQDFSQNEIEEMKRCAEICFFFGDTAQSIMSFKEGGTQDVETTAYNMHVSPLPLYFNYRLTIENAEVAIKVFDDNLGTKYKRNGEKPKVLNFPSFDAQLDEIIRIVQNRALTNVGILMPFNTKETASRSHIRDSKLSVEYVHDYLLNKGVPNEFKYNANQSTTMDLDFHSTNIKIMTWFCAKGLQFKDVFIPGCYIDEEGKRKSLYVAITRGSERLYILHSNNLSNFFDQVSPECWDSNEEVEDI